MFISRVRFSWIILALSLTFTPGGVNGWSVAICQAGSVESNNSKITILLRERLATLKEIAAQTEKARENGTKTYVEVHEANEAVLRAELDLADTQETRIAIQEKLVAEAKKHEEHVAHLVKAGQARSFFQLNARVHRLEAEIALEREREMITQRKEKK